MVPPRFAALLESLRLVSPRRDRLAGLSAEDWEANLDLCDRTQLTLPLGDACGPDLPEWVRKRIEGNFESARLRAANVERDYIEIQAAFERAGIEYIVLKGFTKTPDFTPDHRHRVQYDLDFFIPRETIIAARDVLLTIGYEPLTAMESHPTDHLPAMIRKTGWQWRGNFYDPDLPTSVDLHFRLWDKETEGFDAPGWENFWERRTVRKLGALTLPCLHPADALSYHCMHMLRHLLRGDLRPSHAYELAYFLHNSVPDSPAAESAELGNLQAIPMAIAVDWFAPNVPVAVEEQIKGLPGETTAWLARYSKSPLEALFHPNKHELWLHLSLLESWTTRAAVLRRRLLPTRFPGPVDAVFVPDAEMTPWLQVRKRLRYAGYLSGRVTRHLRTLPSIVWHGAHWCLRHTELTSLPGAFYSLLAAALLFNLGQFVFYLLFNLHLLDSGYREDSLGLINATLIGGSITGAVLSGYVVRWAGLRNTLLAAFCGAAICSAARAMAAGQPALLAASFLAGIFTALYFTGFSPAIAQLAPERLRPRAFSLFFACGIGTGVIAGLSGGRLTEMAGSKQTVLLAGSALLGLAAIPAFRLKFSKPDAEGTKIYPTGSFVKRFLLMLALWSFAMGALNPLFNAYFAKSFGVGIGEIGYAFSISQLAQVGAVLLAPLLLRRAGLIRGIAIAQITTASTLLMLAALPSVAPSFVMAAFFYCLYMSFQYMGEPGLYSLLMNRIPPEQQSGASSLNFVVIFLAQAAASFLAGRMVTETGYSTMLTGAALVAAGAAVLLWRLPGKSE